jgi:hypothetical protein
MGGGMDAGHDDDGVMSPRFPPYDKPVRLRLAQSQYSQAQQCAINDIRITLD